MKLEEDTNEFLSLALKIGAEIPLDRAKF